MKILKSYRKILLLAMLGVLVIGSPLYWYGTPQILQAFHVSWLFLGIAVAIIATPLGNTRLSPTKSEPPRHRCLPWWGLIILFEISLTTLFWGICELNGPLLPILTKPSNDLFINYLNTSLLHMGLFPWALYAVLAVAFAHTAYVKQRKAYTCSLISPFIKLSPKQVWGMVLDTGSRIVTLCALISTVTFITLLLGNALAHDSMLNVVGLHPSTLMTLVILFFLLLHKRSKEYLHTLVVKQNMPTSLILYLFVISMAFILIILGTLLHGMNQSAIAMPSAIRGLLNKGWETNWHLFFVAWWWAWSPVMGLFLARLSRGHTVRATFIAILALPALVSLAVYLATRYHLSMTLMVDSPAVAAFIAMLGFVILTGLIMRKRNLGMLGELYLPKDDNVKHRAADAFMYRWLKGTSIIYYVYLPVGMAALGVTFFLSTMCFSISTLLIAFALLKGLRRT